MVLRPFIFISNKMKKVVLNFIIACIFSVITTTVRAQIVLHEVTDVSQTKATLSADFPDLSDEHGFQYKYGTLPEIDNFSKLALSSVSDPVQINTTGYVWSARTVKGWVESKSNLPVGKTSVMSAVVNFSELTTVTFEWSVDSEEGIGILSFIVDGKIVREISGVVDFTQVSYQAAAGKHTLQWQYKKKSTTNVGLDLGMVRNIDLQNTTEGRWITKYAENSFLNIDGIYPEQNYLYRAFSNKKQKGIINSPLGTFKTLSIPNPIGSLSLEKLTQTKVSINANVCDVDTSIGKELQISTLKDGETSFEGTTLPDLMEYSETPILDASYRGICRTSGKGYVYTDFSSNIEGFLLSFHVNAKEPFKIKFKWRCIGQGLKNFKSASIAFYIDGVEIKRITSPNPFLPAEEVFEYNDIEPGSHVLSWYTYGVSGCYAQVGGCTLERKSSWEKTFPINLQNESFALTDLLPNHSYQMRIRCFPNFVSSLEQTWKESESDQITFTTLPITAEISSCDNIKQGSATIRGKVNGGDATIIAKGLQYKDSAGTRWTNYPKNTMETDLSQDLIRLKPNTTYNYRSYIQVQDCDSVFSEIGKFTTLSVEALKPTVIRVTQHEAELQGKVRFGDASIYQRGMQFRKKGEKEWKEVEDNGNDSIYTLEKKDLEMGEKYETRTYIQPAGCDVIYSNILEFKTLDNYFTEPLKSTGTQTTMEFSATLADVDKSIIVEEYGFEYYLDSDGFFEENFVKSDVIRIPVIPENNQIKTTVNGLAPSYSMRFRAYAKINGENVYYTGYKGRTWDYAGTDRAIIKVFVKELTQTSVTLKLDATQIGDALVSQIEYAFANSVQDTKEYQVCGNEITIKNLTPNTKYNLRFRGTVNGHLCPLMLSIDSDYSWFEFITKAVTISANFKDITQTKATMELRVNAGDMEVSNLKYRLNDGDYTNCSTTEHIVGLTPGTEYTVSFVGKVNGTDYYWTEQPNTNNAYKFTTRKISVSINSSAIEQTSATISLSYIYGDATYLSSCIEYGTTTAMTESVSNGEGLIRLTELMPNTTYYYCAFVKTKEGGKVYSSCKSFKTSAISCTTLPVSNISNRSAMMNGTIDCDSYSSAEFGFQWKQMEGWNSAPAFTKGVKKEDGSISVTLVNGLLEPNTDYQYRTAVRYKGNIYYADNWKTFRTESEFVYYPARVYTIYRSDRENNCMVLCGYFVAGSEDVIAQGYEYWKTSALEQSTGTYAIANNVIQINTDESMLYRIDLKTLEDGNYSVRAFVKTSSGNAIYGETLAFGVQGGDITSIDDAEYEGAKIFISNGVLSIFNASRMSCVIYDIQGQIVVCRQSMTDREQFFLTPGNVYIVRLSNGITYKVRI